MSQEETIGPAPDRYGVRILRRVHTMWARWQLIQLNWKKWPSYPKPIIGKYQYIIRSPKGAISIIELPNYFMDGVTLWEAYCIEGDHFAGELRYNSYTEAEIDARRHLEVRE